MIKWMISLIGIFFVMPLYASTHTHQGVAHYRAGNYEQAIHHFSQGKTADDFYNLGNAHAKLHHYELALQSYNKALTLQPEFPDATFNQELVSNLHEQQLAELLSMQHLIDDPSGYLRRKI